MTILIFLAFLSGMTAQTLPKDVQIVPVGVTDPDFSFFRDGLRPVEGSNGKYGYANAAGKIVIPHVYDCAEEFHEGRAVVLKDDKWGAIDPAGKLVIPLVCWRLCAFERGLAVASVQRNGEERFGILDRDGRIVVPFSYDEIELNGLCPDGYVRVGRYTTRAGTSVMGYGFLKLGAGIVVPLEYEDLDRAFSGGLAWFRKAGKFGFLDTTGAVRIAAVYEEVKAFREGLAAVRKNGKWGFVDETGRTVIGFKYDAMPPDDYWTPIGFNEGVAVVGKGFSSPDEPCWGYIDKTGRELSAFIYYRAHPAAEGLLAANVYEAGEMTATILTTEGKVVLPPTKGYIGAFSNGRARFVTVRVVADKDDQNAIGYVDRTGKLVVPMKYTDSGDYVGESTVAGYARVSTSYVSITGQMYDPRFWTIDRDGTLVKPYGYDSITNFREGVAAAYDITGQKILAFIVDRSWKAPEPLAGAYGIQFPSGKAKFTVDGKVIELQAYAIGGATYVTPRDLAKALDGTAAGFDLAWDEAARSYSMLTREKYSAPGSELPPGDGSAKSASLSSAGIRVDGMASAKCVGVSIAGADYFILDELVAMLGLDAARDSTGLVLSVNTKPQAPRPAVYRIVAGVNDGMAIGISAASTENGAWALTWDNDAALTCQEFTMIPVGGKYALVALHSGKALTAENKRGAPVTQQPYAGSAGQLFTIEYGSDGGISIKTSFGSYLGVSAGNRERGTPIITWDRTGDTSQKFWLSRME